jgi:hypothetical protein
MKLTIFKKNIIKLAYLKIRLEDILLLL